MAKVNLDVPEDLHLQIKHVQLEREAKGDKANLRDIYIELIRKALEKK